MSANANTGTVTPGYQTHVLQRMTMLIKRLMAEKHEARSGDPLRLMERVLEDAEYFRHQLTVQQYPDETIQYTLKVIVRRLMLAEAFTNNAHGVAPGATAV